MLDNDPFKKIPIVESNEEKEVMDDFIEIPKKIVLPEEKIVAMNTPISLDLETIDFEQDLFKSKELTKDNFESTEKVVDVAKTIIDNDLPLPTLKQVNLLWDEAVKNNEGAWLNDEENPHIYCDWGKIYKDSDNKFTVVPYYTYEWNHDDFSGAGNFPVIE